MVASNVDMPVFATRCLTSAEADGRDRSKELWVCARRAPVNASSLRPPPSAAPGSSRSVYDRVKCQPARPSLRPAFLRIPHHNKRAIAQPGLRALRSGEWFQSRFTVELALGGISDFSGSREPANDPRGAFRSCCMAALRSATRGGRLPVRGPSLPASGLPGEYLPALSIRLPSVRRQAPPDPFSAVS